MFARINSMGLLGVDGFIVDVQTDLSQGLPGFDVVGLPGAAVRESRDRVRASMKNAGFDYPVSRIIVNLAPADIRKEGSIYDLPLLLSLLKASKQLDIDGLKDAGVIGELSLAGEIRPVKGVLPMVIAAKEAGLKRVFIPNDNADEGAVVEGIDVYAVSHITQLIEHLKGETKLCAKKPKQTNQDVYDTMLDYSDVRGQQTARRALEVAAAGGHNVLLIGPPGSGKSMLAQRLPTILPDMTTDEALETTKIHSIAGTLPSQGGLISQRPFRCPHHGVSVAGLAGGGSPPIPGEVSLAHNGVLFLDELPEFSRTAMESLRQPLEDGEVTISRVVATLTYPCSFMMVAAMNPCPCGYFGHPTRPCQCTPRAQQSYLAKISGPLLDRIDLHVEVPPVDYESLTQSGTTSQQESSKTMRERVNKAREVQIKRFKDIGIVCNANIPARNLRDICVPTKAAQQLLKDAFNKMGLSARGYDRLLKVSRTIADLESSSQIDAHHVAEAVQYRGLDRKYWNTFS